MLCQTRDNSDFRGKKQIYLCAHPEDREFYLKELKDDFFYFMNCAVWHDDGAPLTGENRAVFYRSMDLILVPVTEQLLFTENEVRDREIPLLKEWKVPLLPVITGEGLFEETNRLFDNRQVLDLYTKDETALGYYEKLERYLKGVFLDSALEKKIRGVFSRHLFLSYRKKDRAIALGLMDRIHEAKALRTLGIWYDEFLTPSENFNKEIKASIDSACCVVMLITPNTLEKENYIITDEYPHAAGAAKRIIGITTQGVDPQAVGDLFPMLEQTFELEDPRLSEKLAACLGEEGAAALSAHQQYLLGCAYLNGIGTERQYSYALDYLSCSAEEGVADAADLLTDLYFKGIGAAPDAEKGLFWADRRLEILLKTYLAEKTEPSEDALLDGLLSAAHYYNEADRDAECRGLYEDAFELANDLPYSSRREDRLAEVCNTYGVYLLSREDDRKAAKLLGFAEGSLCERANQSEALAEIRYNLGTVYLRLGREQEAMNCFTAALAVYSVLSKEEPERYGAVVVKIMGNLGIACRNQGRRTGEAAVYAQAERWLEESVAIAENLRSTQKEHREALLAKSYSMLALFCMQCDEREKSAAYYEKAMDACCTAIEQGDARRELLLAEIELNYCALLRLKGQYEEALLYAKRSAARCKKRFMTAPALYAFLYAKTLMVVGLLYGKTGNGEGAVSFFESALRLYRSTERTDHHLQSDVAECYLEYGRVLLSMNQAEQAEQYIRHAMDLFTRLKETMPHYYEHFCNQAKELLENR